MKSLTIRLAAVLLPVVGIASLASSRPAPALAANGPQADMADPSPIALALSTDGSRLLVAEQGSGSTALIDTAAGMVVASVPTGDRPAGVGLSGDGKVGVVAHWYGYDVAILEVGPDSLKVVGRVEVGPEPRGVAVSGDGKTAYVAVGASNEVVRVDVEHRRVSARLQVGREPRGIALTPDGSRLLVGNARSKNLSVISTQNWTVERTLAVDGDNLRQVIVSNDGTTGYVAHMRNRGFATTARNIDIGWVLGQRISRVPLDGSKEFASLTLDPRGQAAGDAHGVALGRDGRYLAVSCGGTHEILIFRTDAKPLPWTLGTSRDLIEPALGRDKERFRRVEVGGRPTEMAFAPNGKTLYVANYLGNSVQIVDAETAKVAKTISLGGSPEPSLTRKGEVLFHDATRSFNQWYSCNTCHSDGHTNGLDFDTMNDGWHDYSTAHTQSRKKVPTLRRVARTGPWTWHGWQESLDAAVVESFTKSMQGKKPSPDEVRAVVAYLETLDYPRNPNKNLEGGISSAARRGEAIFRSTKAACSTCHGGPEFTDGKIHTVGLEGPGDVYQGYNPPSLRGVYDKEPFLHDGRSKTLREILNGPHAPEQVLGNGPLNDDEMDDLIAYLKTL